MIRFSLRIPADLHEQVTVRAAADRRSLNSEILHLLQLRNPPPPGGRPHRSPAGRRIAQRRGGGRRPPARGQRIGTRPDGRGVG
ncbi:Arc family DNA-binding protein, partial [Streptomyces mirabilis]|uniref:Arc family DNA-binding protein n=1 Tax=Streptomyces mirabilis TaxID=68239 RepID=UPI0036862742